MVRYSRRKYDRRCSGLERQAIAEAFRELDDERRSLDVFRGSGHPQPLGPTCNQ